MTVAQLRQALKGLKGDVPVFMLEDARHMEVSRHVFIGLTPSGRVQAVELRSGLTADRLEDEQLDWRVVE